MNRTAVARQPRITRTESIAADLLREIHSGTWAVGDELPTRAELCGKYGVSRLNVRTAIQRLEDQGLVTTRGQRHPV